MKTHRLSFVVAMLGLLPAVRSWAQPYYAAPPAASPPPAEEVVSRHVGVGYKIGNGLGFVGADLLIEPIEHLTFDLQANWYSASSNSETVKGFGVAPAVQFHFKGGQVSSAYIGAGYLYARLSQNEVTASAQGAFMNAGYEWRWSNGLGILLGGGIAHLGSVRATDGFTTVETKGGTFPNLEVGFRYLFL
jgi:hypothetical protein